MTDSAIAIHPIRNEEDYEGALLRIGELMGAEFGSPAGDELDALASLVVSYEEKHFPIAMPSPIAAIEFRLEQQGLTRKDLEPMIGSRARVSEIMTGKRKLTLPMIRSLRDGLGIPADVLIGDGGGARAAGGKAPSPATGSSISTSGNVSGVRSVRGGRTSAKANGGARNESAPDHSPRT